LSIERGQAVILVVGGMLVGAGVTTLVLKKHYQKLADEEIASVKAAYKKKEHAFYQSGVTQEDVDNANVISTEIPEVVDLPAEQLPLRTEYHKMKQNLDPEAVKLISGLGYVARDLPETVELIQPMTGDPDPEPYIISVDQFMANEEEFEQITLTYYEGDEQLVDDAETLVDDVATKIGYGHLKQFGKMSGNGDTVYVRNYTQEADYEIIRDYRSYGKDMMGEEEMPPVQIKQPKPPKTPKFRGE
jgi:hypothetical protein